MDPQVIGRYLPVYGRAVLVTVEVSALGILLAIAIGLLCASVRYARVPAVGRLAGGYVQLARNTPLIVLLFFIAAKLALSATNHYLHHGLDISPLASLIVVILVLLAGVVASLLYPEKEETPKNQE